MLPRWQRTAQAVAVAGGALAEAMGEPGAVPAGGQVPSRGRLNPQGVEQIPGQLGRQVPPDPEQHGYGGGHGVVQGEGEPLRGNPAEFNAALVIGAVMVEAIVTALNKATAAGERAAAAPSGLRLAAGPERPPDLHRLDPVDGAIWGGEAKLEHVVCRPGAFVGAFRANGVAAGAGLAEQPAPLMAELQAELIRMGMGWQVAGAGNAALAQQFPAMARAENRPAGGRQIGDPRGWLGCCGQGCCRRRRQGPGGGTLQQPLAQTTAAGRPLRQNRAPLQEGLGKGQHHIQGRRGIGGAVVEARGLAAFEAHGPGPAAHRRDRLQQPGGALAAEAGQGAGELHQAIEHQQVIAGTALLMAAIGQQLGRQLAAQQAQGAILHAPGCDPFELQAADGQGREVFEPVVAAVAVLGMGLQPAQLLPERCQPRRRGQGGATAEEPDPVAAAQRERVAVPGITTAGGIGGDPVVEQGFEGLGHGGPVAAAQGLIEPGAGPVEVVEMELPEALPGGIVPGDGPSQLPWLVEEGEVQALARGGQRAGGQQQLRGRQQLQRRAPAGGMILSTGTGQGQGE